MAMKLLKDLKNIDLKNKRVLYRPDYNVPMLNGEITDTYRITATYPTIEFLISQGAKIIIASHLGRPDGHRDPFCDIRPVAEILADHFSKNVIRYAQDVLDPNLENVVNDMNAGDILLLPNVRYYAEEESNAPGFAKTLAHLADIYVNDAFACDHRAHASIVGVPELLPGYAGFLVEKEVENLGKLIGEPEKPFVVIMGGAKVSDKIEVISALAEKADKVLIGGAMANTFLLAKGEQIGQSKAEPEKIHLAEELLEKFKDKIILPVDYVKDDETLETDFRYMDIGEKTVELFKEELKDAKTIFWNGSLGYAEDPKFAVATQEIARYIGSLDGVMSVVAGGDTVETITKLDLHDKFSFVSTGGGAALEFLAGKKMPGIEAISE